MHVSETGDALALQPEDEGEETALTRLRAIFRRATQYSLPSPYWETPDDFLDLDPTGSDALVFRDGAAGADTGEEKQTVAIQVDGEPEYGEPSLRFDPNGSDIVGGTA